MIDSNFAKCYNEFDDQIDTLRRKKMKEIKHNKMRIFAGEKGHFYLSTRNAPVSSDFIYGHINTNLTIDSNFSFKIFAYSSLSLCIMKIY